MARGNSFKNKHLILTLISGFFIYSQAVTNKKEIHLKINAIEDKVGITTLHQSNMRSKHTWKEIKIIHEEKIIIVSIIWQIDNRNQNQFIWVPKLKPKSNQMFKAIFT